MFCNLQLHYTFIIILLQQRNYNRHIKYVKSVYNYNSFNTCWCFGFVIKLSTHYRSIFNLVCVQLAISTCIMHKLFFMILILRSNIALLLWQFLDIVCVNLVSTVWMYYLYCMYDQYCQCQPKGNQLKYKAL